MKKQMKQMKKTIIILAIMLASFTISFAQQEKDDLVDKVATKHYWVPSAMVDNFVTVNFSPEIWSKMLDEVDRPVGVTSFANLGMGISKFLDNTSDTKINKLCGFGIDDNVRKSNMPICQDQIKEAKGRISVTVNAKNIKVTEDSYMLLMKSLSVLNSFLGKTDGSSGWKPKSKNLSIIINTGTAEKDLGAKWNADFSVFTITTSPYIEVPGWSDKIENVFKKGINQ